MTGFDIFAIAFVLLVIVTLFAGIKTVPQGYDWTIEIGRASCRERV